VERSYPDHTQFRTLAEEFSLVRLSGKQPVEKHWNEFSHKRRTFTEIGFEPGENAGIACGPASSLLVIDVDDPELFAEACRKRGWEVPETRTVETGNRGHHLYFKYPADGKEYGNKSYKRLGFDVRGVGGMIVASGSIHPETGKRYSFMNNAPVVDTPEWLLNLYNERTNVSGRLWESLEMEEEDVDAFPISHEMKELIKHGAENGQRSEAIMSVVNSLVNAHVPRELIHRVFNHFPIGEKYREKCASKEQWLDAHIHKAEDFINESNGRTGRSFRDGAKKPVIFTAKDLDDENITPPAWIVPDMLAPGITLLAAPPKTGKTRLASAIALNLVMGEKVLGLIEAEKCEVLFLCLEDSNWRIKERLSSMMDGRKLPNDLFLTTSWPAMDKGGKDELCEFLEGHRRVRLVIIDLLEKVRKPSSSKNVYQSDYEAIGAIKEVADRFSVAILVIHHTNKLQDSPDVFCKVSGSTGLTGACDTVMVLERMKRSDADAKLQIAGRDVEAVELTLKFDRVKGSWTLMGEAEQYCLASQRRDIVELLKKEKKPLRSGDIAKTLGRNHNTVRGLLQRMVKDGIIYKPDRGLYALVDKQTEQVKQTQQVEQTEQLYLFDPP